MGAQPAYDRRPRYETPLDLFREKKLAEKYCKANNLILDKLSPWLYGVDFAFYTKDGRLAAWCEIKCRERNAAQFETFFVASGKWARGLALSRETSTKARRVPFALLIGFEDGAYLYHAYGDESYGYDLLRGGRTDRKDKKDEEPMVHVPFGLFRCVSTVWRTSAVKLPPKEKR